jgi:hypothetical protein
LAIFSPFCLAVELTMRSSGIRLIGIQEDGTIVKPVPNTRDVWKHTVPRNSSVLLFVERELGLYDAKPGYVLVLILLITF